MQAVILAAGTSSRLKPMTNNTPKCLLPIGKTNILHRMIENIIANNINEIIIVTGYLKNLIKNYLKENFPDVNFTYIDNDDYENNNNCYSLWLVKDIIKDKMLLLDSDILFEKEIIKLLIEAPYECSLAVNCHSCGDEEIKITVDPLKRVKLISKTVDPKSAMGESIGIEFFSGSGLKQMFETLNKRVSIEGKINEWYEASFQEWIDNNGELYAVDITNYLSMEIDFADDIKIALETIIPKLDK